jgi:hypothetical protein
MFECFRTADMYVTANVDLLAGVHQTRPSVTAFLSTGGAISVCTNEGFICWYVRWPT